MSTAGPATQQTSSNNPNPIRRCRIPVQYHVSLVLCSYILWIHIYRCFVFSHLSTRVVVKSSTLFALLNPFRRYVSLLIYRLWMSVIPDRIMIVHIVTLDCKFTLDDHEHVL